jgi:hypothetical protein
MPRPGWRRATSTCSSSASIGRIRSCRARRNGQEPWLLQRPAAPQVWLGDWRNSLGQNGIGVVPRDGTFTSEVCWPERRLLGQNVLVRALFVSPDGQAVVGTTPAVPLAF